MNSEAVVVLLLIDLDCYPDILDDRCLGKNIVEKFHHAYTCLEADGFATYTNLGYRLTSKGDKALSRILKEMKHVGE